MKIEWKHLFRSFLRLFRRKNYLGGLQKENETKKTAKRAIEESIIYLQRGIHHVQVEKAYLWIITALEASNLPQVTFFILTNFLTSISKRFGPKFEPTQASRTHDSRNRSNILMIYAY